MSSTFMDFACRAADILAGSIAIYCLALLLMIPRRTRNLGILIFVAETVFDVFVEGPVKALTARDRPFVAHPADLLIGAPSNYSFPSGHTANAFILALSVFLSDRRIGGVALAGAAFVAFSRLYLFVHWPTDVLAGALFALLCVAATHYVLGRFLFAHERKMDGRFRLKRRMTQRKHR